jgi:hypothetical protein
MIRSYSRHGGKTTALTAALGALGLAVAGQAGASCMSSTANPVGPNQNPSAMHMTPAIYRPAAAEGASFIRVSDSEDEHHDSIVGLWQFKFVGFGPDYGTQAWHSDGTELIYSGGQNPETGDVCQGVWRRLGPSTYSLNHIAMGRAAPGASFGLRVHIHAVVKVDESGNKYSGKYTAAVYSVSATEPFDESVEVASGTGVMTGTRVKPD